MRTDLQKSRAGFRKFQRRIPGALSNRPRCPIVRMKSRLWTSYLTTCSHPAWALYGNRSYSSSNTFSRKNKKQQYLLSGSDKCSSLKPNLLWDIASLFWIVNTKWIHSILNVISQTFGQPRDRSWFSCITGMLSEHYSPVALQQIAGDGMCPTSSADALIRRADWFMNTIEHLSKTFAECLEREETATCNFLLSQC